jgi:hypothetical protein
MDCRVKPGNDDIEKRSRGAHASEVCDHHQAKNSTARARKRRGERSAERRIQPCPPCRQAGNAPLVCVRGGARRRRRCSRNATASGRARLPAFRCGSRAGFETLTQLQARLPGMFASRALPARSQAQCRDSTSRRGRSAAGHDARSRPGTVCETARRRRIPLRNQDRIRNAPLDERDSSLKLSDLMTLVNNKETDVSTRELPTLNIALASSPRADQFEFGTLTRFGSITRK